MLNQLTEIVRKGLPHLTEGEALDVARHLTSDEVGVWSLSDLYDLNIEMMPRFLKPLKRNQLLSALKAYAPGTGKYSMPPFPLPPSPHTPSKLLSFKLFQHIKVLLILKLEEVVLMKPIQVKRVQVRVQILTRQLSGNRGFTLILTPRKATLNLILSGVIILSLQ